jgi:hypothetical protein
VQTFALLLAVSTHANFDPSPKNKLPKQASLHMSTSYRIRLCRILDSIVMGMRPRCISKRLVPLHSETTLDNAALQGFYASTDEDFDYWIP